MCGAETGINPIERYYCEKGGRIGLNLTTQPITPRILEEGMKCKTITKVD